MTIGTYCSGCKTFKILSEFTNHTKDIFKQLKTCNNCRQRFTNKRKRSVTDDNQLNSEFEIVDLDLLSETIMKLLKNVQSELHFHCKINNSNDNNSSKDLANEIVELIEVADEYR